MVPLQPTSPHRSPFRTYGPTNSSSRRITCSARRGLSVFVCSYRGRAGKRWARSAKASVVVTGLGPLWNGASVKFRMIGMVESRKQGRPIGPKHSPSGGSNSRIGLHQLQWPKVPTTGSRPNPCRNVGTSLFTAFCASRNCCSSDPGGSGTPRPHWSVIHRGFGDSRRSPTPNHAFGI